MKKWLLTLTGFALFSAPFLFADELGGAEAPVKAAREGSFMPTLIMLAVAMAFFYLVALRPERKRRKALMQKRESMRKGDRVTAMGIIGTVVRVQEETVILKMYDGAKLEVLKAAITDFRPAPEGKSEEVEVVEPAT